MIYNFLLRFEEFRSERGTRIQIKEDTLHRRETRKIEINASFILINYHNHIECETESKV